MKKLQILQQQSQSRIEESKDVDESKLVSIFEKKIYQ